jgi:hypothetical protein
MDTTQTVRERSRNISRSLQGHDPWRQLHCLGCNGFFLEHHGTIFHGKQASVELIVRVLACLVLQL